MTDQKDRDRQDPLINATLLVAHRLGEINEQLRLHNNNQAILIRLAEMEKRIMEAIDTFAASVNASFETLGTAAETLVTAVDGVTTAVTGIEGDVKFLKEEIAKLQASQGPWTPQDQTTLDGIQTRAGEIAAKVGGVSTTMVALAAAAAALDAATETVPAPPPTE